VHGCRARSPSNEAARQQQQIVGEPQPEAESEFSQHNWRSICCWPRFSGLTVTSFMTDRLLLSPGNPLSGFQSALSGAVTGGQFLKDSTLSASEHPGMSTYGVRHNKTLFALQAGFGQAGAFVDISLFNPLKFPVGTIGHAIQVLSNKSGHRTTDPFEVGRGLGSGITGYTCA
jgi:hypothetical protein